MYLLLQTESVGRAPVKQALWFGGVVFGIDWLLYSLALPLFVDVSMAEFAVRVGIDIFSVIAGLLAFELIFREHSPRAPAQSAIDSPGLE